MKSLACRSVVFHNLLGLRPAQRKKGIEPRASLRVRVRVGMRPVQRSPASEHAAPPGPRRHCPRIGQPCPAVYTWRAQARSDSSVRCHAQRTRLRDGNHDATATMRHTQQHSAPLPCNHTTTQRRLWRKVHWAAGGDQAGAGESTLPGPGRPPLFAPPLLGDAAPNPLRAMRGDPPGQCVTPLGRAVEGKLST